MKAINLDQWLQKHKSFFETKDFQKVEQALITYDQETLDKVCGYLKGGITYLSKKHDYRLYSPKTMLFTAILGISPMLEFTMHSKYSVLTHWLWYFLQLIKYVTLGGLLVWYIYDILTVKKRARAYNIERFTDLIALESQTSENKLSENIKGEKVEIGEKKKPKSMKTVKIMSIIGLIGFFGLFLYFFYGLHDLYQVSTHQQWWEDDKYDFFRTLLHWSLSGTIVFFAIPYTIFYTIVGLCVSSKKTIYLIGLIIGIVQLSCVIFYIALDEYQFAYYVHITSIFVFVLYVVGLIQSLKYEGKKIPKITHKYLFLGISGLIVLVGVPLGIKSFKIRNSSFMIEKETDKFTRSPSVSMAKYHEDSLKMLNEAIFVDYEYEGQSACDDTTYRISNNEKIKITKGEVFKNDTLFCNLPLKNDLFSIETLYFIFDEEYVVAIYTETDMDGEEAHATRISLRNKKNIWTVNLGGFNMSTPIYDNKYLYVGTIGGIYKLDYIKGKFDWKFEGLYSEGKYNSFEKPQFLEDNLILFTSPPSYGKIDPDTIIVDDIKKQIILKQ